MSLIDNFIVDESNNSLVTSLTNYENSTLHVVDLNSVQVINGKKCFSQGLVLPQFGSKFGILQSPLIYNNINGLNYFDLSTNQICTGIKTFTNGLCFSNGLNITSDSYLSFPSGSISLSAIYSSNIIPSTDISFQSNSVPVTCFSTSTMSTTVSISGGSILPASIPISAFVSGTLATYYTGPTGPTGGSSVGSTGPTGLTGPTGYQGLAGYQGSQGSVGTQGAVGNQGSVGNTGSGGIAGVQGAIGIAGPQGISGPQGATAPVVINGVSNQVIDSSTVLSGGQCMLNIWSNTSSAVNTGIQYRGGSKSFGSNTYNDYMLAQNNGSLYINCVYNGVSTNVATFTSTGPVINNITTPSDARYKTDISNINYGLNEINQLRPVSFQWIDDADIYLPKKTKLNQIDEKHINLGFIAQEVSSIIPEAVKLHPINEYYHLDTMKLIPILIKAIQDLSNQKNMNADLIHMLQAK